MLARNPAVLSAPRALARAEPPVIDGPKYVGRSRRSGMPSKTSEPLPGLPSGPFGQATWISNRSRSSAFIARTWMKVSAPGNSGELMNSTGVLLIRLLMDFAEDGNSELPQHL